VNRASHTLTKIAFWMLILTATSIDFVTSFSFNLFFTGLPGIKVDDFVNWFGKVPEEKLKEALDFKILNVDARRNHSP